LMSSVYQYSSAESKPTSLIALLFTTCFGVVTIVNHSISLIILTTSSPTKNGSVEKVTQPIIIMT
jgi:hypothetical protein